MKKYLIIIYLAFCFFSNAQTINCKVLDADDKIPLSFATITYGKDAKVTFSDSLGNFYLSQQILNTWDSFSISFIGYERVKLFTNNTLTNKIFYLKKAKKILDEVVVKSCNNHETIETNFKKRSTHSYSISPFLPLVFSGYFPNELNKEGFLNSFSIRIKSNNKKQESLTPIRLHWYSYDSINIKVGKELTDSSLIFYPASSGINHFEIPDKLIYFGKEGIVLGIEFLYTHEQELSWEKAKANKEMDWISNNSWSFNIIQTEKVEGFVGSIPKYFQPFNYFFSDDSKKRYLKPLFNFTIKACK